ncbi:MAG TPA: carboxymuconolactone decarboxylase family protein [Solirubrobacteraceae bacterium]|jgi:AhpD family alkylhydroperoxidase|nr:carboxymuconolactone decarboxylase family protein [Solirubrobacteraceae bacterium]
MSPVIPAGRMQLSELAPDAYNAMSKLSRSLSLDKRLRHLIEVRASQLNGCAFCLDMHWKDARAGGETEERLAMLAAWHDSPLFDERERAALSITEEITVIGDGHVSDEAWDDASEHFDEAELAQLVFAATVINAWNRLMITARVEPGHYQPGMFG